MFIIILARVFFLRLTNANVSAPATYEKKTSQSQAFDFDDIVASTTTLFDTLKENDIVVLFNNGASRFFCVFFSFVHVITLVFRFSFFFLFLSRHACGWSSDVK